MRTLKKTLCLVLCLAMMAGLCVFATADFKDQEKIENEEAVAVLTGIGVIQGDDKGNFNPEGTLTRAEATVIITKILDAADIKATTDAFTDVTEKYWGMPYIAYCVAEGIVAGMGDGTFAPNAKLTGYQWATMLLRALGYKVEGANWQIDVAKLVKSLGLAEGMTFNGVNEITRQDACQMALNAMFVNMVEYVGGSKVTIGGVEVVTGETLKEIHPAVQLADTFNLKADDSANQKDELGNPIELTYTAGKKNTVIYTKAVAPVLTITDGSFDKAKLEKAKYDFRGVTEADIVYNGGSDPSVTYAKLGKPGATVKIYGTQSGKTIKVTDVVVEEYYLATIKDYNVKTKAITLTVMEAGYYLDTHKGNGTYFSKTLTYDKNKDADEQSDEYLALAGYDKGDVFAILVKGGWETSLKIFDTAAVETVEGKVTSSKMDNKYNGYVKIDGVQYTFANEYNQTEVGIKDEGTFYLFNGCILGFEADKEDEVIAKDFAYVYEIATQTENSGDLFGGGEKENRAVAKVAFTDGTVEVIELNLYKKGNNVTYKMPKANGEVDETTLAKLTGSGAIGYWFGYVKESDGTYTLSKIDSAKMNAEVVTGAVTTEAGKTAKIAGKYTNSATTFTAVDTFENKYAVTKATGLYEKPISITVKSLITYAKGSTVISAVYFVDGSITAATPAKTDYAYAAKAGDDVENGTEWTFYIGGEKVTKVINGAQPTAGKVYELVEITDSTNKGAFALVAGSEKTLTAAAKVTVADSTFFVVGTDAVEYAKNAVVYDITEGADGVAATVEAGDYVQYLNVSGSTALVYIVDDPTPTV